MRTLVFIAIFLVLPVISKAETPPGFQQIVSAFVVGEYDQVDKLLGEFQERADLDSVRGQMLYLRGRFADWRNDPDQAFEWFEKAIEMKSDEANYHYWLGLMYGSKAQRASYFRKPGHARNTLRSFEKAVALDPTHLDGRMRLVDYHLRAPGLMGGDEDEARRQADEMKAQNLMRGHLAWAAIHRNHKDKDLEEASCRSAYEADPKSSLVIMQLGGFLHRNKRRAEAIALCETYLASNPHQGRIIHYLGSLLRLEKQYEQAYELVKENADAFGDSLKAITADNSFVDAFDKSMRLRTRQHNALYLIGLLASESGMHLDHGLQAVDELIQLAPKSSKNLRANTLCLKGEIYVKQEKKDLARQAFEMALTWNKKHKRAKEALKKMK